MRHVFILLLSVISISVSAQSVRRDSLLNMGRAFRDAKLYVEAINNFTEAGGDAGRLELAHTRYVMGEFRKSIAICKELIGHESIYSDDAQLLIARIREAQGLNRVARYNYRKLVKAGNAEAPYYFALMKHKTGHNNDAVELLQIAIQRNKHNMDAHIVLSEILINGGQRYLAMLPIMYSLLYNTDTRSMRESASQLEALWSNKSHIILNLVKNNKNYVSESATIAENHISDWIRNEKCNEGALKTECLTPFLLRYLKANQEEYLDWWQMAYADFFISICDAGFEDAFVHHLCAALQPDETRSWIEANEGKYAEFLTWLSLQR